VRRNRKRETYGYEEEGNNIGWTDMKMKYWVFQKKHDN
jgi:hypothetical protein